MVYHWTVPLTCVKEFHSRDKCLEIYVYPGVVYILVEVTTQKLCQLKFLTTEQQAQIIIFSIYGHLFYAHGRCNCFEIGFKTWETHTRCEI